MRFSKFIPCALLLAATASAGACPDCSIRNNTSMVEQGSTTAKLALSDNVLLMIGIVFAVLGFMVWMMVKTCREFDARRVLQTGTSRS